MENRISIPKPCHENWDNMLPEEQGRHCLSCCKTVIDFSSWDNDSILSYLQNRNGERVCGRFDANQVASQPNAPQQEVLITQVLRSGMPLLRKIAAVIVLCFGLLSAGESHAQKRMGKVAIPKENNAGYTKGEIAIQPADTAKSAQPVADTLKPQPQIMGMIAPYHPPKQKPAKKIKPIQSANKSPEIK